MSFVLEASAQRGGLDWQTYPRLAGVLKLMHARPAYHRALASGGPYSFAT
jgi:glutathione S-transferase